MDSLLARDHGLAIHEAGDALSVISSGLPACIFTPSDLHPDFFDLRTGLAGEAFQKFVNYRFQVAFVVPGDHDFGERVTELMRDHATHPCIRFFATEEAASDWLSSSSGPGGG